jgi:hypothetical protein
VMEKCFWSLDQKPIFEYDFFIFGRLGKMSKKVPKKVVSKKVVARQIKPDDTLPNIRDFVLTEPGRRSVLSGKVTFPLRVQPAEHLKNVMSSDVAHAEKVFRIALREKQFDYAEQLVDAGIVPSDVDLIFNCCNNPTDFSMNLVLKVIVETQAVFEPGYWNRSIFASFHTLFMHEVFTPLMEQTAAALSAVCNVNDYNLGAGLVINMLHAKRLNVQKIKELIAMGVDFSLMSGSNTTITGKESVLNHLTNGIDINEMIEILTLIRDQKK